jgi:hypothetical protein
LKTLQRKSFSTATPDIDIYPTSRKVHAICGQEEYAAASQCLEIYGKARTGQRSGRFPKRTAVMQWDHFSCGAESLNFDCIHGEHG